MDNNNKKPYIVNIQEHYYTSVVVWAEDEGKAAAIADSLCDRGEIDMERNCYAGWDVYVQGVAGEDDLYELDEYEDN